MAGNRFLLSFISLVLVSPTATAQEGRGRSDKELKRAAHRLRIDVEKLKNARQALREATELARRLDPLPVQHVYQLVQLWIELDRSRAGDTVESIVSDLRTAAQSAKTLGGYQQATSAAHQLLSQLVQLDPEKAVELAEQWPEPAPALGKTAGNIRENLREQLQSNRLWQLLESEPEKAAALLAQRAASDKPTYSQWGQVAERLMNSGKKEEAQRIIDQAIANFGRRSNEPRFYQDFATFAQFLARVDPDRFPEAVALLAQPSANGDSAPLQFVYFGPGKQLRATSREAALLNMLQGASGQPELALKALNAVPDIKAKLKEIGGLDCFLHWTARCASEAAEAQLGSPEGPLVVGSRLMAVTPAASHEVASRLVQALRGKAATSPSLVRQRLLEAAGSSNKVQFLTNVAQMAEYADSDLSSLALELAGDRISEIQPLQERAAALQNLISIYRQVEGEVDAKLIKEGYVLADQIREQAAAGGVPGEANRRGRQRSPADFLEAFLTGEYARDNFDGAIRFVRSMDDDEAKLSAFLQIAQSLRNSY